MTKRLEKIIKNYESKCELWAYIAIDGISDTSTGFERLRREEKELRDFIHHGFHFGFFSENELDAITNYIISDKNASKIQEERIYDNWEIAKENYKAREESRERVEKAV